jgi:small subunit ribosomal protein S20
MANHKSSIKRIRANEAKRLKNRYQAKTVRTLTKEFKGIEAKEAAAKELPTLMAKIDKLAKKNIYHKNKASRIKSQLMRKVNAMGK